MGRIINEDEILHLDSIIGQEGKYEGMKVKDAICENRACIMQLLKRGLYFDDEVIKYVGLQKIVRDDYWELDYNGIIVYSTKWGEDKLKPAKVKEISVSHEGVRDESFYQV